MYNTMVVKGKYPGANFILEEGIEVDLSTKCFSRFTSLFKLFKIKHACTPLPDVNYVLLFKTLYYKCESCRIGDADKNGVIQLSLVYNRTKKLVVNVSDDLEYAKQQARQLASTLHVRIKDVATDRMHPKWLV